MAPVNTSTGPPGGKGDSKWCACEKYSASTPFDIAPTLAATSGAAQWKSSASASVAKRLASVAAAARRSKASRRAPSRRYSQDIGHGRSAAYWVHFAESTSQKSTMRRPRPGAVRYCAIGPEKATASRSEEHTSELQ